MNEYYAPGTATVAPAAPRGLTVTIDPYGSGVNDAGVPYDTYEIARPATATRNATTLASLTVYGDGYSLVFDRYTGDGRPGDLKAIQAVRDMLVAHYPDALADSWRYTVA